MNCFYSWIFLFLLFITSHLSLQANLDNGKKLYVKCILCHGKDGEGKRSMNAPKIGGQHADYLFQQLINFKSKKRRNPQMYPFIMGLKEQDFKDLSEYIQRLRKFNDD